MERFAREKHLHYHKQNENSYLKVFQCSLVISPCHPWLAATPDIRVYDPKATPTHGLVEYKKMVFHRNMTIEEDCEAKG